MEAVRTIAERDIWSAAGHRSKGIMPGLLVRVAAASHLRIPEHGAECDATISGHPQEEIIP
jgi:hypothetical protein